MRKFLRHLLLTLSLLTLASTSYAQILAGEGFVPNPTKTSQASGNWATGSTWAGNVAPATNEVFVTIASGHTVTIAEGTSVQVQTIYVAAGGTLILGRGTTITTTNAIYRDTGGVNPQFETGIIVLGTINTAAYNAMYPQRTPWTRVSNGSGAGIASGATSMTAVSVTGWQIGDRLRFPDTRDLDTNDLEPQNNYTNDERVITNIAGNVVSWTTPLTHAYPTARDHNLVVERYPMVANMTRDIVIKSESAVGTRGHFIISDAGIYNLNGINIQDYGRTTTAALDVVTNHIGRYAFHAHHSSDTTYGDGIFTNGVIENSSKWGMTIHDSNFKTISSNVVYNASGWCIGTEMGTEHHNVFDDNLVFMCKGTGDTAQDHTGISGMGFWMTSSENFLHRNVAVNTRAAAFGTFSPGTMAGSVACGACLRFKEGAPYGRPFEDNEAIASSYGLGFWGIANNDDVDFRSVVYHFMEWHNQIGLYAYSLKNFYFINFYSRNDPIWNDGSRGHGTYNWFGDYAAAQISFWNADIQNKSVGMQTPYGNATPIGAADAERSIVFRNSTFHNLTDILVMARGGSIASSSVPDQRVECINCVHTNTTGIHYDKGYTGVGNLRNKWRLRVTNYQNVQGDNFEVYASQQAASFVMPQSDGGDIFGSVDLNKTNQENHDQHGYSTYGEILPGNASTRPRISDYVVPFPDTSTITTSVVSQGHTFTLGPTADNINMSNDVPGNDTVLVDGSPNGNRGWGFLVADGRTLVLGVAGRWAVWDGSSQFTTWPYSWTNPPGTYTLTPSTSGKFIRWDNHAAPYSPYIITNDHEILAMGEYGLICSCGVVNRDGVAMRTGDGVAAARMSGGGRFLHPDPNYVWDMAWCDNLLTGQDVAGGLQYYTPNDNVWLAGAGAPQCILGGAPTVKRRIRLKVELDQDLFKIGIPAPAIFEPVWQWSKAAE